jgi:hypothetical protein
VARLRLTEPPSLVEPGYRDFRPWLDENFYCELCSYCLLYSKSLSIDHYEPQGFAAHRVDDPRNLLLGCSTCQGPAGKWDYHPHYAGRRKWRDDESGYLVIDVRSDDLSEIYELADDGELCPCSGELHGRAVWNMSLLKLDLYNRHRAECLDFKNRAEEFLELFPAAADEPVLSRILDTLVRFLARRRPFFLAFGVKFSGDLRARIDAVVTAEVGASITGAADGTR